MIGTAVASLHRLETIVPTVQDLGRRHIGYGIKPAHYQTVGAALLWTLERGLGDELTSETRQAWVECYTSLATTMQQAAQTP